MAVLGPQADPRRARSAEAPARLLHQHQLGRVPGLLAMKDPLLAAFGSPPGSAGGYLLVLGAMGALAVIAGVLGFRSHFGVPEGS